MAISSQATIKLDKPLQTHKGFINEITFRAPTVSDYFEIGDLFSYVTLPGRSVVTQVNMAAYLQYAERLVQLPATPLTFANGDLRLAAQIREVIDGFFTDARKAGETSPDSSENSGKQESSTSSTSNE